MKKPAIIFDLDGTLWDSAIQVAESWTEVGKKEIGPSFFLSAQDVMKEMGKTMDQIIRDIAPNLSSEDAILLAPKFYQYEIEYLKTHPGVLFNDELTSLMELAKLGYPLYIVSNCQAGYIETFLPLCPEGTFLDYACWSDTGKPKDFTIRYLMERNKIEKAIYIGDIQGDEDSAHKAGLPFIHAKYGFGQSKNPQGVISSFVELKGAIKKIEDSI